MNFYSPNPLLSKDETIMSLVSSIKDYKTYVASLPFYKRYALYAQAICINLYKNYIQYYTDHDAYIAYIKANAFQSRIKPYAVRTVQ